MCGKGVLGEKGDSSSGEVEDGADDFDLAGVFEVGEFFALGADDVNHIVDVFLDNGRFEFGAFETAGLAMVDCGVDLGEHISHIPAGCSGNGRVDGAAVGVAEDHYDFGCGVSAGIFKAAEDVIADNVSGYSGDKNVPYSLVKKDFHRDTGIDAAEDYGLGVLAFSCREFHLLDTVALEFLIVYEAGVSGKEVCDDTVGGHSGDFFCAEDVCDFCVVRAEVAGTYCKADDCCEEE